MKTAQDIRRMKGRSKIAVLTVYDHPTAAALDLCELDILLMGDSVGQVELGLERTAEVTMEMMIHHLAAVRRGVKNTHLLVDMPFGSYTTPESAVSNARRLVESGADSVKLEGPRLVEVEKLVVEGIDVLGHVGLLPQTAKRLVRQGTKRKSAARIREEAGKLEEAGCYALVLEHMPDELSEEITEMVSIPTIGIGAGLPCDGQVLVVSDVLGLHEKAPPFVKQYARLFEEIVKAGSAYRMEVKEGVFPPRESPVKV